MSLKSGADIHTDKGVYMYFTLTRYFLFFIFLTLFSYGGGNIQKPSAEEEIRDTIVVHGMVLHGQVTAFGPERLSFKLQYSEGINRILYKDIESINTKYNYHISFKRIDIEGRVVGIEDNEYIKVMEGENERTIKIADIDNFVTAVSDDASFENRLRNKYPYTKGRIHIGFEQESGTSEKSQTDIELRLRNKQAEHEVNLFLEYEFETTETADSPKTQNKDALIAILTYKNHFDNNQYYYGALMGDYDRPRLIDQRFLPSVGYGYRFRYGKSKWLEPSLGIAYAMTQYTDSIYADKNFAAAALRLAGKYQFDDLALINTLILTGNIMYFPSLEDRSEDWIFRSNLTLAVPLFDFFSIRLSQDWINDSNPAPAVGNNKETTKIMFGLDF